MRLSVIGCGYVGLVTGACLAEAGHEVVCTDIDRERIAKLNGGGVPIYEQHLDQILMSARKAGRISYTADAGEAIRAGDAIFICVGTPGLELSRALSAYSRNSNLKFRVASNPEFLREGTAVGDFFHPDRIVVGVEDPSSAAELREIYRPILERSFQCPVHNGTCPPGQKVEFLVTTISSAELIKHAANSFLALKISYANVIADLCEKIGANVEEVTHAMGLDPRIGGKFLNAGLGYGGFCFPKDVQAFIHLSAKVGVDFDMLKATERVNKLRIDRFFEKIHQALWVVKGKHVAVLGLAFKPNTDDIRFAPALEVIKRLLEEGAVVSATDPEAMPRTKALFPQLNCHEDPYNALRDADAALICTEWDVFKSLDWGRAGNLMARRLVIDGRNIYTPQGMRELGFEYYSFGRE